MSGLKEIPKVLCLTVFLLGSHNQQDSVRHWSELHAVWFELIQRFVTKTEGKGWIRVVCTWCALKKPPVKAGFVPFSSTYVNICQQGLKQRTWGIWGAGNHCGVFLLRDWDERQMDDEEAILEDKQQVLALQWTWKTQFTPYLCMVQNQEDQEVF